MKKFIGTKMLLAVAMTLGDYNIKRGWTIPENEDPNREGYLVEYPLVGDDKPNHVDHYGYISWSPKEAFESAYRETTGMNFGLAIEAAKQGKLIARSGWNGKGMFVFLRPSDKLSIEMIVNKVKSLPESLKKHYQGQFAWTQNEATDGNGPDNSFVEFNSYFCMKAADGSIVNGWLASQTDMLAEDWLIVE